MGFEVDESTLPRMWWHLTKAAEQDLTPEEMTRLDPSSISALCRHYKVAVARVPDEMMVAFLSQAACGEAPTRPTTAPPPPQPARSTANPSDAYTHLNYPVKRDLPFVQRDAKSDLPKVAHRHQIEATKQSRKSFREKKG